MATAPPVDAHLDPYLFVFRGSHVDFRLQEVTAVAALFRPPTAPPLKITKVADALGIDTIDACDLTSHGFPQYGEVFYFVQLESEQIAADIGKRCLTVKLVLSPWGCAVTYNQCLTRCLNATDHIVGKDLIDGKSSFKCFVESFGRSYSTTEQVEIMHRFSPFFDRVASPVKMKNPGYEVWILEDIYPRKMVPSEALDDRLPRLVIIGRKIVAGASKLGVTYSLKTRAYIGTTSMDAELAFLMANQALVRPGSLVLDPFVGTGSVAVSCSAFGAQVLTSDIDWRVLKGRDDGRGIWSNFKQYRLDHPLAISRADLYDSPWRQGKGPFLDAVVCDPPYGIRESIRSIDEDDNYRGPTGFVPTRRVTTNDTIAELLELASTLLVTGGRLVYWLPTTANYKEEDVPLHPWLSVVSNSEQIVTRRFRRRLLTMEKLASPNTTTSTPAQSNANGRRPAHADLAAFILRSNARAEERLEPKSSVACVGHGRQ